MGMNITETEVWGFNHALRGMRNPLESYDKADSKYCYQFEDCGECPLESKDPTCCESGSFTYVIGHNDLKCGQKLIKSGPEHRKFLRMIHVAADVDIPRYMWSEWDTYHFNTKNSRSTMHKLLNNNNPITLDMFIICEEDIDIAQIVIERLEELRQEFKRLQKSDEEHKSAKMNHLLVRAKRLLMEGFLQLRTIDTNYEELRTMYFQRKNHRLHEEWGELFCSWVESLPYAQELILYTGEEEVNAE